MEWQRKPRFEGVTKTEIYQRHYGTCKGGTRLRPCSCPWWIYGYINGQRIRESLRTNDAEVAAERQKQRETGNSATPLEPPAPAPPPAAPPAETHSLADLIGKYIASRIAYASIVDATVTDYTILYRKFREYMEHRGAMTIEALTPELMEDYLVSGRYKPRTRFKHYRMLLSLFKFAAKRTQKPLINLLPEHAPRKPKEGAHRPLTQQEQQLCLDACQRTAPEFRARDRAVFLALVTTGLRRCDVYRLAPQHVNFARRELTIVMQKTRAHRAHPIVIPKLPPVLMDALRALPRSTDPAEPFFNVSLDAFRGIIKSIFKRADVKASSHDCRVTFAVERLVEGKSIWDVSQLLGHSSTAITEKYYIKWVQGLSERLERAMDSANFSHLESTGS